MQERGGENTNTYNDDANVCTKSEQKETANKCQCSSLFFTLLNYLSNMSHVYVQRQTKTLHYGCCSFERSIHCVAFNAVYNSVFI